MTARSTGVWTVSIRIGDRSLGAIGRKVAAATHRRDSGPGLSAIATGNKAKAQAWVDRRSHRMSDHFARRNCRSIPTSRSNAAPAAILGDICLPMLNAGKPVMVLSASALLPRARPCRRARAKADRSLSRPTRCSASTRFSAPPKAGLKRADDHAQAAERAPGAPYLIENNISVEA